MLRKLLTALATAAVAMGIAAGADAATTLKIGTLAPGDSAWGKEFKKWAKDVSDDTGGELGVPGARGRLDELWQGPYGDHQLVTDTGALGGGDRCSMLPEAVVEQSAGMLTEGEDHALVPCERRGLTGLDHGQAPLLIAPVSGQQNPPEDHLGAFRCIRYLVGLVEQRLGSGELSLEAAQQ